MEDRAVINSCGISDSQSLSYITTRKVLAKETGKALTAYMRENIKRCERQTVTEFFRKSYDTIEKIFKSKVKEVINTQTDDVVLLPLDDNLHLIYAADLDIKCVLFTDERGLSFNYIEDKDILDSSGNFRSKGEIILKCGLNKVVYR